MKATASRMSVQRAEMVDVVVDREDVQDASAPTLHTTLHTTLHVSAVPWRRRRIDRMERMERMEVWGYRKAAQGVVFHPIFHHHNFHGSLSSLTPPATQQLPW